MLERSRHRLAAGARGHGTRGIELVAYWTELNWTGKAPTDKPFLCGSHEGSETHLVHDLHDGAILFKNSAHLCDVFPGYGAVQLSARRRFFLGANGHHVAPVALDSLGVLEHFDPGQVLRERVQAGKHVPLRVALIVRERVNRGPTWTRAPAPGSVELHMVELATATSFHVIIFVPAQLDAVVRHRHDRELGSGGHCCLHVMSLLALLSFFRYRCITFPVARFLARNDTRLA